MLVAVVLLAEHLAIAVVAAALGLLTGWAVAPALTEPSVGLLDPGTSAAPTPGIVATVLLAALAVTAAVVPGTLLAVAALTAIPVRYAAARPISTVLALNP